MTEFFAMGGYAGYVWSSFGATFVILAMLWFASSRELRGSRRILAAMRSQRGKKDTQNDRVGNR